MKIDNSCRAFTLGKQGLNQWFFIDCKFSDDRARWEANIYDMRKDYTGDLVEVRCFVKSLDVAEAFMSRLSEDDWVLTKEKSYYSP